MTSGEMTPTSYVIEQDGVTVLLERAIVTDGSGTREEWAAQLSSAATPFRKNAGYELKTRSLEAVKAAALELVPDFKKFGELAVQLAEVERRLWPEGRG